MVEYFVSSIRVLYVLPLPEEAVAGIPGLCSTVMLLCVSLLPCVPGVFFYLSSAVNPIIYNLLSRRFRTAFRNVIAPSCKQWHPQHHPSEPPAQRNIFLTECPLVELTEEAGARVPCRLPTCSPHLPTCSPHLPAALCIGQAPRKELAQACRSSLPPWRTAQNYACSQNTREVTWLWELHVHCQVLPKNKCQKCCLNRDLKPRTSCF